MDEWRDAGRTYPSDWWLDSSIGVSRFLTEPYTPDQPGERAPRKIASIRSQQTTIFGQAAAEQRMEGEEDSTGLFPGYSEILVQWKKGMDGAIASRGVTYDFARLMEGASEVKCSEFGDGIVSSM